MASRIPAASRRRRRFALALAKAAAGAMVAPVAAAPLDSTWTLNNNGNWSVGTNWSTTPNVPNGIGDTARFLTAITAPRSIGQNVAGLTLGQVVFSGGQSYLISGNAITLDAVAPNASVTVNTTGGSASHRISSNLVLNDPLTVTTNASASLPLTFDGTISGTGGLTKTGPGYLLLQGSAANTFSGDTTVNDGTLEMFKSPSFTPSIGGNLIVGDGIGGANADIAITRNGAIPDSANVTINNSGQLQVPGGDQINNLWMNGGGVTITGGGPILQVQGSIASTAHANEATISGAGSLQLVASVAGINVEDGAAVKDLHISSRIQGGGGFVKVGAGTLALSANNIYVGTTTILEGTLQFGNGSNSSFTGLPGPGAIAITNHSTLSFKRGGTFTIANNISGNGNLVNDGNAGITLTGNNTYSGTTTVSSAGGLFVIGDNSTTGNIGPGNVILSGAGSALAVARTDSVTIANNISGIGGVQNFGSGTTTVTGTVTCTGAVVANDGKLVLTSSMPNTASVFCSGDGVVEMASDGTASHVMKAGSVLFFDTGQMDLKDNKLILTGQPVGTWNGTAYSDVLGLVQKGYNGGAWNGGPGIITSMSDATTGVLTTLAVARADDAGYAGGTFAGISVNASDVLVMYTWGGDADLNGQLNGDDYFYLDSNILQIQSGATELLSFHNGDFNYDGAVNGDDYFVLDSNILQAQANSPFPTGAGVGAGLASVPEPGALSVLAMMAALTARRRRTSRSFSTNATASTVT